MGESAVRAEGACRQGVAARPDAAGARAVGEQQTGLGGASGCPCWRLVRWLSRGYRSTFATPRWKSGSWALANPTIGRRAGRTRSADAGAMVLERAANVLSVLFIIPVAWLRFASEHGERVE